MNIKRFTAPTSREALAKARMAFGEGTLILSNRPTANGVEVMATAEDTLSSLDGGSDTGSSGEVIIPILLLFLLSRGRGAVLLALLVSLISLALFSVSVVDRGVLDNVGGQLVDVFALVATTTGVAVHLDQASLIDNDVCLGVTARGAEDELLDESVQQRLQLGSIVGTVNNVAVSLLVNFDLSTELATKVLGGV